jgi:hypothetical protein
MHFVNTLMMAEEIRSNGVNYNFSLWPFGVIAGLAFLVMAIMKKEKRFGITAGPFLSPYALIATYGTSLLAWINKPVVFFIIWLLTWIPLILKLLAE